MVLLPLFIVQCLPNLSQQNIIKLLTGVSTISGTAVFAIVAIALIKKELYPNLDTALPFQLMYTIIQQACF